MKRFSKKEIRLGNARLRKLAQFLKKVPEEHFDMLVLLYTEPMLSRGIGKHMRNLIKNPKPECGTAACAMGWAPIALSEVFQYKNGSVCLKEATEDYGFLAAETGFYLTPLQVDHLFTFYPGNRTASEVSNNILEFVQKRQAKLEGSIKCKAKSRTTRSASKAEKH